MNSLLISTYPQLVELYYSIKYNKPKVASLVYNLPIINYGLVPNSLTHNQHNYFLSCSNDYSSYALGREGGTLECFKYQFWDIKCC